MFLELYGSEYTYLILQCLPDAIEHSGGDSQGLFAH